MGAGSTESDKTQNGKNILFLCKCDSNISDFMQFDEIKSWAKKHGDIDIVATANLLCSPKEKEEFAKVINKYRVNNIVIAACSPKLHQKTFQDIAEKQGINISKISMANIREQCAWITPDKNEATEKAKAIINAA
ncbi:MAG: hypothetical protein AB1798_09715, partial [Spirochaetota bacterium]